MKQCAKNITCFKNFRNTATGLRNEFMKNSMWVIKETEHSTLVYA